MGKECQEFILLNRAAHAGVQVSLNGDDLKVRMPVKVDAKLVEELKSEKPGLVSWLKLQHEPDQDRWLTVPSIPIPFVKHKTNSTKRAGTIIMDYARRQICHGDCPADWVCRRSQDYQVQQADWSVFRCEVEASLDLVLWQRGWHLKKSGRERQQYALSVWLHTLQDCVENWKS